jgi:hypothetical protein
MFILKRQDVELSSIQHPKKDQQVPILRYQGQTFRLIHVFSGAQEEEAKAFWRDLTDNRGKACVLLEEPERFSVWGKIYLDQLAESPAPPLQQPSTSGRPNISSTFIQAALLLLQAVHVDIEDLLGVRQASAFHKDITSVFQRWQFPQTGSPEAIQKLLTVDPLTTVQVPAWGEQHINTLLEELYRLCKQYFGNSNFTKRVLEALQDMTTNDRRQFLAWLQRSPSGKLWC